MPFAPTTAEEERVAKGIVDAAFAVHKALGPGLLENVYEVCFCHELTKRGLSYGRQVVVPIVYDGITFDEGLRLDVLVEDVIICELKAVETMHPVFTAQLLTYLKLAEKRLGFLINFNVPLIKRGIKRVIL
ncbi:MAG: GxxExxY protein [Chloroflexota bacterium]|nr:GxxExxY protein [Chloroflexota bacterium]